MSPGEQGLGAGAGREQSPGEQGATPACKGSLVEAGDWEREQGKMNRGTGSWGGGAEEQGEGNSGLPISIDIHLCLHYLHQHALQQGTQGSRGLHQHAGLGLTPVSTISGITFCMFV